MVNKNNEVVIHEMVNQHDINDGNQIFGEENHGNESTKNFTLGKIENAVEINNVNFEYRKGLFLNLVLNNVNMNVKYGEIYALLGPSGCGKTTILRNILGRIKPKSGSVKVFGVEPGTRYSNIPGLNYNFTK